MSYGERKSNRHFRTSLDIGMGIFYVVIGGYVFVMQSFGTMKIPSVLAYLLGGMMMIGGVARFNRGFRAIYPKKKDNDTQPQ
jgi:hypothetical protein